MSKMASVQERAAALNITGKLYSPMNPPREHRVINKPPDVHTNPLESKETWRRIVEALRSQVSVKKRRQHLKSHENCFLGSDAVDVVQLYLSKNKLLGDEQVSRCACTRVCQALLDCGVFEGVGSRLLWRNSGSKAGVFHDSSRTIYRFLSTEDNSLSSIDSVIFSPAVEESLMNVTPMTPCRQDLLFSHSTPEKADKVLDLLIEKLDLTEFEQTVRRLSQLIDLPLLEGVLTCSEMTSPPSRGKTNDPDLLYTSSYLDREVLKAFRASQSDTWLSAAIDLLDFLPDHLVMEVSRELPSLSCEEDGPSFKSLLFHILDKHYGHMERNPLLCESLSDVYTEVMELLATGRLERALEVLQLMLKLLAPSAREELRRLLEFMAVAAEVASFRLHKGVENRVVVKKTFTRAVIQSRSQTKGKVDLLILFMLDNHQEIFKIPGSLHKLVSERLDDIAKHKDSSATDIPFCQQVPQAQYKETTKDSTKNELYILLKNIDENNKYSQKEKNRLLSQFYNGHPDIFMQYFGTRLNTLNLVEV
ncbi:hypothetical protein DNTS_027164 [Danionella cerebrum]|uniref:DEP domain-containing protein 7 n=1 Tax=Danionella cerebrum TaxID=2873325 RepID=A0A553QJV1_9TELE|nr:hypothetical protein DNTS_027164 [Danionella translucida]